MLKQLQKRREEGFTIIEVMIVLAIAGLIILVVLLAIPALQRNSRNTTIKNDASAVAGAINEFSSTNNGKMPTSVSSTADSDKVTVTGTASVAVDGKVQGSTVVNNAGTMPTEPGVISVALKKKCNDAGTAVATGNNPRSAAVLFILETSSGTAPQCLDS